MLPAFMRGAEEVRDDNNSWLWMKGYLKKEIKGLIMATKHKTSMWIKHYIDRTADFPKCRLCGKMDENVSHI